MRTKLTPEARRVLDEEVVEARNEVVAVLRGRPLGVVYTALQSALAYYGSRAFADDIETGLEEGNEEADDADP